MAIALIITGAVLLAGLFVFVWYGAERAIAEQRRALREYATEMGFDCAIEYERGRGGLFILIQGNVESLRFLARSRREPDGYSWGYDGSTREYTRVSSILWDCPGVRGWSFREQGTSEFPTVDAVDTFIKTTGRHARADFAAWQRGEPQDVSSPGGQRVEPR